MVWTMEEMLTFQRIAEDDFEEEVVDLSLAVGWEHATGHEGFRGASLMEVVAGTQRKTGQHETLEVHGEQVNGVIHIAVGWVEHEAMRDPLKTTQEVIMHLHPEPTEGDGANLKQAEVGTATWHFEHQRRFELNDWSWG